MKAEAPGKLVLSGEHSVVYGAPALALAVQNNISAEFFPNSKTESESKAFLTIKSEALGEFRIAVDQLQYLKKRLDLRFSSFEAGDLPISQVLTSPSDLLFYTLAFGHFDVPGTIEIQSSIPTGSGMGSSAAVIAALLCLTDTQSPVEDDYQTFIERVRFCERLQHGRGSALDATMTTQGGLLAIHDTDVKRLDVVLDNHWFLWHSGYPASSTGEAVERVRGDYAESSIWTRFADVTEKLGKAVIASDQDNIISLIRKNHRLLLDIGVVPEPIARVIMQLEKVGCAAKICGAGAVRGDAAGQVLIYIPKEAEAKVASVLKIDLQPLVLAEQGVRFIHD